MSNTLKHAFNSGKSDGGDATKVRASNWNAEHTFAGGADGSVLSYLESASDNVEWVTRQRITGVFNVLDYGATGNGSTNDTTAIQAAIDAALAVTTGGVVFFPAGTYAVTSLNLSNSVNASPTQSLRLVGVGRYASTIKGTSNGAILIDAIGRSYFTLEHLRLTTNGTAVYQTALLLARRTGGAPECRNNGFSFVRIDGEYSIASVVAIASECDTWYDVEMVNEDSTNNYCCFFTGLDNDIAGVSSTHGTVLASTNTYNLMTRVTWGAFHANATPVIFDQGAGYNMVGCSLQVGAFTGVKCVTYIDRGDGPGGGFNGPVNWIGSLWEVSQATAHYLKTQTVSVGHFQDIVDIGGSYTMGGTSATNYAMQTNGTEAVVLNCRIENVKFIGGSGGTMNITVDHVYACHFDIWSPSFDTTITIGTGRYSSFLRAKTLSVPGAEVGGVTPAATTLEAFRCANVLATGTGKTVDEVITVLQNLGLVRQS
jgi:hypothetical protein